MLGPDARMKNKESGWTAVGQLLRSNANLKEPRFGTWDIAYSGPAAGPSESC